MDAWPSDHAAVAVAGRVEASFGQYQNLTRIRATEGDVERLEREHDL